MRAVCVFCGSNNGGRPEYAAAATALGTHLAGRGIDVVYGGASVGLMGAVADAALAAGGRVTGVIPRHLVDRELAHPGLTDLHVTESMHERKALMTDLSEGFIALPGGFGTLEELAEVTTWAQLGLHAKPIGLLDVAGFYELFLRLVDLMVAENFVPEPHRRLLVTADTPAQLVDELLRWEPVTAIKWMPTGGAEAR
jgi:uncharacterized protein (TIGR00730 family)